MNIRTLPFVILCLSAGFASFSATSAIGTVKYPPDQKGEEEKEERLAWWKEARFGMFIHWGVYSSLAGEWRGERVDGYSENIKRICKINRSDYLNEVVLPFNPIAYDADQWVRSAKKAGMGYIVITAMHHDGVAMFDSAVDDLNVVKMSPFKRDPIAELKTACDRHGIRLGFYYSHAIDWSLEGDPRYPEPSGPERRKACVEKKVIPQIRELIHTYNPDLIWGDTQHHNPRELNMQVLELIRREDPDIIINGRLAKNEGDYLTTTDRPAQFSLMREPSEKYWEAIPTTNESYGYHRYDNSHKPPAHFIRLLAAAAARGGNLLMNIGPRGDGTFAPEDMRILEGIQTWWALNSESIRGTERTPLFPQSWGESTLKGNTLYLHVFHWPDDGRLLVGGLDQPVIKASLLADPELVLNAEAKGKDTLIYLPQSPRDAANSVIAVECVSLPSLQTEYLIQGNMSNDLSVFSARMLGKSDRLPDWKLGKGRPDSSHVQGWSDIACGVEWDLRTAESGLFDVSISYSAPEGNPHDFGGSFKLSMGDHVFEGVVDRRGNEIVLNLGRVFMEPGSVTVSMKAVEITGGELMRLLVVTLQPLSPEKEHGPANSVEHETSDEKQQNTLTSNAETEMYDPTTDPTLSAEHLAWEILLKENLGDFYYPRYLKDRAAGVDQAWDYVKDDPALPRVLIIGDSISRGYTLPVRKQLAGKVNVHRAPENCGPTFRGLERLDLWLGQGQWDLIVFNFGIHDRHTESDVYWNNLEEIIARLKATDAKLLWVTTTPVPKGAMEYVEGSIDRLNPIGVEVARSKGIPVADLHASVLPILADFQFSGNCHFMDEGYAYMGQFIARQVTSQLAN